jgi:hypothetical protein
MLMEDLLLLQLWQEQQQLLGLQANELQEQLPEQGLKLLLLED